MGSSALKKLLGLFAAWGSFSTLPSASAEIGGNRLTRPEELSGWKLLFDGKSTTGWRNYKKTEISEGWKVVDGALVREGKNAGDIVTKDKYKYFELSLEYKISEGGNSGLMFHVTEDNPAPWHSGPEVQIQDNVAGRDPQKSGWLYQMYKPVPPSWTKETGTLDATRPAGQWNQIFLRISPNKCEVSMNGMQYFTFNLGDAKWKELVKKSKFAAFPGFGTAGEGHICLQDHGNLVSFRDIKIRPLADDGSAQQPIDGKLNLKSSLAFPNLKWEGWEPLDENGNVNKSLRILDLTYAKGDGSRLFAMDQRGMIFTFENRPDVEKASLFLDIQQKVNRWFESSENNEQGLLGLALHPKFKENGQLFVSYTLRENDHTIVSRFQVSKNNSNKADPNSEVVVLDIPQPYKNHNGGAIEFGPDGYLYISLGDGGARNDPKVTGQDRSDLLGSILRIDIDRRSDGLNYAIPTDNPFVGDKALRPEIFAYGIRNPWRIAFDKKSGRLWCGDVGQELWEEVNVITKGGNYGWSSREGSYPFGNRPAVQGVGPTVDPVWEYDHGVGKSITGGRVYNSSRVAQLTGKYLYGDYVSGSIWALSFDATSGKATRNERVIEPVIERGMPVMAFGEDANGEVYYMIDSARGQCIYRFDAN